MSTALKLFIHISPEADHLNVDNHRNVINGIDDPHVADPEAIAAFQLAAEMFDVIMVKRIHLQTIKRGIETTDGWRVRFLIKFGGLSGKLYLIHCDCGELP